MKYEAVIKNGIVADGTGGALMHADVGVAGGRIAAMGMIEASDAEKVFDASGMVVSPGFIDAHAHTENSILRCPDAIHKISQGITMEITGHCGDSCFPVKEPSGNGNYADLETYRVQAMQNGIGIDQANMIGHGNLRVGCRRRGRRSRRERTAGDADSSSKRTAGRRRGFKFRIGVCAWNVLGYRGDDSVGGTLQGDGTCVFHAYEK